MLVTFRSKAWGNVTLFGDVALTLLKMMGHSGTVPSALLARDIPSALARLKQALAAIEPEGGGRADQPVSDEDDDAPPPVTIRDRRRASSVARDFSARARWSFAPCPEAMRTAVRSQDSASAVEPARSVNTTVTRRRSLLRRTLASANGIRPSPASSVCDSIAGSIQTQAEFP
jgi:hypothetical protein